MAKCLALVGMLCWLACWSTPAAASGDGGCNTVWSLEAQERGCSSRIVIGPGNDTRVNMLLLLREQIGLSAMDVRPDDERWRYDDFGRTFLEWSMLVDMLYPIAGPEQEIGRTAFAGTRCQSVASGGAQLVAAVARNRRINAADRARLAQGREAVQALCQQQAGWNSGNAPEALTELAVPRSFSSVEAREFGSYIAGAAAFYAGDWRGAKARFVALRRARDEWVRETARYMEARNALAETAAAHSDEWGYFDPQAPNDPTVPDAERAFASYIEAYPSGRYATSARGLIRRARWLRGEAGRQADSYTQTLANTDPDSRLAADLIAEIDDKFLFAQGARDGLESPLLLATLDLLRMRRDPGEDSASDAGGYEYSRYYGGPPLTAEELSAQQALFADQPDLFSFLQANHAFYVINDYRRVLELLPDDARRASYSPLQFSRQMLRGMALARLGDRNEVGFWQELLGGSRAAFQHATVELGLALAWERAGQVELVFAPNSPIVEARIRQILLEYSAGPAVLRAVASGSGRTPHERDLATYVLLTRALQHGEYAAAMRDLALVPADGPVLSYDEETYVPQVPVGVFARGDFSGDYACPTLDQTIARLAHNARDVAGRLCLGDFFRLNGFDYSYLDFQRPEGSLGSFADYPGEAMSRSHHYAAIIAEPGVAREDRAYALYRAIRCYAPAGHSSCGGPEVPQEQRAAWFERLKGEFGDTRWGREAEYYW